MFGNTGAAGGGRAMKPPGGEAHDLWGAEFKGTPCHHRVLKPPGGGSSDLFGAAEPIKSPRRVRNNMQSSVFGPPATNGDVTPRSKPDGNPVTGEGYTNGEKLSPVTPNGQPAANGTNGTIGSNGTSPTGSAQRSRVPPGGYSSGLW